MPPEKASKPQSTGRFVLMLHSHLPYYRKAGMWPFGEENLYECIVETYLPLLNALYELRAEGIKAGVTVGITPILAEQLADEYLKKGAQTYIEHLVEVSQKDVARYPDKSVPNSEHLAYEAKFYLEHYSKLLDEYLNVYKQDILGAFKTLQDEGCIEITTSAATHGFLPLLGNDEAVAGQVKTGVEAYKRHFGKAPKGIWLPECAYRPAKDDRPPIEAFLFDEGINYFFTEFEAIEGSELSEERRDIGGVYRNVKYVPTQLKKQGKTGLTTYEAYWLKNYPVAVLGRSERGSFQVWSAAYGYPGDGIYREFHKKDNTSGLNYWRITSKNCELGDKMLYDPLQAFARATEHAKHYVELIERLARENFDANGEEGLLMVSFDTELYGHWWFEGLQFLKDVIRGLHKLDTVTVQTVSDYLEDIPPKNAIDLPESTWGMGGHYWVWDNDTTHWMWPIIHDAENKMKQLREKFLDEKDALKIRALNQAYRELLLLEGSDWPFLVTTKQAKDYAVERFTQHVENFNALATPLLEQGVADEPLLERLEEKNNAFPNLDYRWFVHQPKADHKTADKPKAVSVRS